MSADLSRDGKLELRVMDDELVSTPDFLGYAQLEHKELLYKMPGQGWRNLDLIDDPAGVVGREEEEDRRKGEASDSPWPTYASCASVGSAAARPRPSARPRR